VSDVTSEQDGEPPAGGQTVVAIDGPSGSGKSTVARALAVRLGFQYLDTGAMYRAVTWYFLAKGISDSMAVRDLDSVLSHVQLTLHGDGRVALDGNDVSAHLRSREVESRVSTVSAMPPVRKMMRRLQRHLAAAGPVVAEGRDMASVVYPDARWKFYLDALPAERARRRCAEFLARGRVVTEADVLEEIQVRDHLDSTRKDAPLVRIADAIYVDTTGMSLAEVIDTLAAAIERNR